ncbi:MAG: cellulase family glycosylhydrolase [Patulibacter minatonensis]
MISLRSTIRSVVLTALAALLASASAAHAASNQLVFFEAPRDLTANTATDATRAAAFKDFTALGVNALRVNLRWSDVAPASDQATKPAGDYTDPATYDWGAYTAVIDAAKAANYTVLISLAQPAPKWATASKADNVTRPNPDEFRAFAAAAGKKFGAPNVIWSIWNEPNLDKYLKPAVSGGKNVSPLLYRALYIAAYAGLKTDAGLTGTKVLFGETAPVGGSADKRIYPITFFREALCLTSKNKLDKACGGKLQIDGVSHHPYQFTDGKLKSGDVTYRNLDRLVTFLDGAAKAGAIPASTPVYYTEFGIQSHPDTILGYNAPAQYEARARAERAAYFNKRVKGFSQYLLTDDTETAGFQTGLRYATGKAKPAYDAYRLTLDATWGSGKKPKASLWGLVRNATAPVSVTIEVSTNGKSWKKLKTVKTNRLGAFTAKDGYRKGAQYRYKTGTETSPPVRAYAGWIPPNARKKLK